MAQISGKKSWLNRCEMGLAFRPGCQPAGEAGFALSVKFARASLPQLKYIGTVRIVTLGSAGACIPIFDSTHRGIGLVDAVTTARRFLYGNSSKF